MRHQTPLQGPGAWTAWQLRRRAADPLALAHLALRTKSDTVLDTLALQATHGRRTAGHVVADPASVVDCGNRAAALALALAGMGRSQEELIAATRIYEQLWTGDGLGALAPIHHQGLGQSFFLAGRHELLRRALPDLKRLDRHVRHDLEVDLANPYLDGQPHSHGAHERWERMLGARFVDTGLEPVRVRSEGTDRPLAEAHLFDRLTTGPSVAGTTGGGPLVTVIMPCYRPDEGLLTSVASLRDQSWAELEILVVDDASGPDYADVFARAVAVDARARLIRLPHNGGSYLARNAALPLARGQFVTFQDADDWSHPRRIEHQAAALLADSEASASRSLAVRARDDLTHQWFGYRAVRDNASSLMVRRAVVEQIGPFAPIRKGADSEYAERLTTLAGPLRDTGTPLAITRLRTGSLSRGDFTYQWASPERLVFKGSYRAWHRRLSDTTTNLQNVEPPTTDDDAAQDPEPPSAPRQPPVLPQPLPPDQPLLPDQSLLPDQPPFPVSRTFVRALDSFPHWDRLPVAYLGDFSSAPDPESPVLAVQPGATPPHAGVWHVEALTDHLSSARQEMHPDWFAAVLASAGALVPLSRLEDVLVERLVVLDPRVLLLAGAQACRVRADRVEVQLTPELLLPDPSGLPVDLLGVADTCRSWWGQHPRWVPAPHLDDTARAELADLAPRLLSE